MTKLKKPNTPKGGKNYEPVDKRQQKFITILTIAGVWVTMFVLMSIQVFNHIPTAIAETNKRIDETNERIDETNERIDELSRLIVESNERTNQRIDESNASTNQRLDAISERLDDLYQLLLKDSSSE